MKLSSGLLLGFIVLSAQVFSQALSPERVAKIKECTVRITIGDTDKMNTGFLISENGLIATSWHVISPAPYYDVNNQLKFHIIFAEYGDGTIVEMSIPNYFLKEGNLNAVAYDYCLLSPNQILAKKMSFLKVGKLENINEGDLIYTCGYPLAISQQFISAGILSTKYIQTDNGVLNGSRFFKKPPEVGLFDLTLNKGNSGGAIVKLGKTLADDEVIGMAAFILTPTSKDVGILIEKLRAGSGSVLLQNVDPNDTMRMLTEFLTNTSIGVSGIIAIDYFVSR